MRKRMILIFGMFFLGLMLFSIPANVVNAYSDIEYYFENDSLYDGPLPSGTSDFNQRNQTLVTGNFSSSESFDYRMQEGNYYGTYSFENSSIPSNFIDISGAGCSISYLSQMSGHNSVLNITDNSIVNRARIYNDYGVHDNGYIEYWFYTSNVGANDYEYLSPSNLVGSTLNNAIGLSCFNGYFQYYDTVYHQIVSMSANTWYHIKIYFDNVAFQFKVWINGVQYGYYNYRENNDANCLDFSTHPSLGSIPYGFYIDAIGYSWDTLSHSGLGYKDGYNLNPYDIEPLLNQNLESRFSGFGSFMNITDYKNHQNVLTFIDNNVIGATIFGIPFESQSEGSIEFWMATNDVSKTTYITLRSGGLSGSSGVYLAILTNYLRYYDGTFHIICPLLSEYWYHIKIDFDCSLHLFNIYVNNYLYDDLPFLTSVSTLDLLRINTDIPNISYISYLDAIGFSWDENYDIGSNRFPIIIDEQKYYNPTDYFIYNNGLNDFGTVNSGNVSSLEFKDADYLNITSYELAPTERYVNVVFNCTNIPQAVQLYLDAYALFNITLYGWDFYSCSKDGSYIYENIASYSDYTNEYINFTDVSIPASNYYILNAYSTSSDFQVYLDLFSFHLLSYNRTESDKIEFTSNSTSDLYALGSNSIEGWTVSEAGGNINVQTNEGIDKEMRFTIDDSTSNSYFERSFLTYNGSDLVQTQISLLLDGFSYSDGAHRFYVNYTDDFDDLIFQVRININHNKFDIWYLNSSAPYGWSILDEIYYEYTSLNSIEFTLQVDFYNNMVFVNYNNSIAVHSNLDYPSENDSPSEFVFNGNVVKTMSFQNIWNNPAFAHIYSSNISLDYVQFIVNGVSISNESLPSSFYFLSNEQLDLTEFNFIDITFNQDISNNISLYLNDDIQLIDYNQLFLDDFSYNYYQEKIYNGIYLRIYNSSEFDIENINIYGIKTVNSETGLKYKLNLDYANVDLNSSYFYVNDYNLYFQLSVTNDNLEYIQASFDIPDLATINRSFYYSVYRSAVGYAQLRLNFTDDTSLWINFKGYALTQNTVMDYDKIIDSLIILASDNDVWNDQVITGHVDAIEFQYVPNYSFDIITTDLMDVFIALIIILVPALIFSVKLGKKNVIYLILMMVILTFLFSFIDFFNFFIWIIGIGILILMGKKDNNNQGD